MHIESIGGVVCCGNISFDMPIWPVDHFAWGTTYWVEALEQNIGGNGGNTATALAVLGVPVRLYGKVGRDAHGDAVMEMLRNAGVDASGVGRSEKPTTATVCAIHPSGDRLLLHRPGASSDVMPDHVRFDDGPPFTHFHMANLYSLPVMRRHAAGVLERAHAARFTTSLDTGWDALGRWMTELEPCLPHVDLLFLNESEGKNLTGHDDPDDVTRELRARGGGDIVIKLGGRGCVAYIGTDRFAAPAFEVRVLDTTGAGDAFGGGFLAALHRGMSYAGAARFANAVGALSVERLGTVGGVRSFDETQRWMTTAHELAASA